MSPGWAILKRSAGLTIVALCEVIHIWETVLHNRPHGAEWRRLSPVKASPSLNSLLYLNAQGLVSDVCTCRAYF